LKKRKKRGQATFSAFSSGTLAPAGSPLGLQEKRAGLRWLYFSDKGITLFYEVCFGGMKYEYFPGLTKRAGGDPKISQG